METIPDMSVDTHRETLGFQAEVKQLLNLMIHSLYSNKEIFLRELISNASDACDKLRFEALTDDALYEDAPELALDISLDKDARTITVSDNGVGMTRDEVVDNIGTIARSGTRQFLDSLTGDQKADTQLIGQFGVGFYSSFIVADKVTLETRRAGLGVEHGVRWESGGEGDYTLETIERAPRGTSVTLHLREGEDDFLEEWQLRSVITRYSDHINLPVRMPVTQPAEEEGAEPKVEVQTINRASALWSRSKSDITDEEYREFYKHVGHDFQDPLAWSHNRVEGKLEYTSLLYVPEHAPFDLWDREQRHGVKLYVQRVFIMEDAEKLMPRYLRFVRGVIDSNDLPLNVSREMLQSSKVVDGIRSGSVKKVLGLLETLAKDEPEKYATFWEAFGTALKEGPAEDFANRDKIAGLVRFASTHTDTEAQTVSLADYIGRMQEDQEKIYYLTGDTFAAVKNSPHLEVFRKKGIEVLLLAERVDEWLMAHLTEFEGKAFQSVAKGALDLDATESEEDKAEREKAESELEPLIKRVKEALGERVKEVRVSHRLTDSPACLVVDEEAMSQNLERMLRQAGQEVPVSRPILELNPDHAIVKRLDAEAEESRFQDWSTILFEQAMLAEGGQLEDPAGFVKRLNELLLVLSD
jgi:molecular chaperone HtpG